MTTFATVSTDARFWHREGERVVCDLCPRRCKVGDGQRAFCFVRQNIAGKMSLTTYGRSSGFCVDPIEKKPLNHFYPGTAVLSFGTAGCNLGCKFCQNWDISKAKSWDRLASQAGPEDIAAAAERTGSRSVAFTYNDPVIFAEYAIDTALACKEKGINTVAVTAGYITDEARAEFFAPIDAINVDLKAFSEDFYHKVAYGHLQPVLDTIEYLANDTDKWVELTTLVIPGLNDSESELRRLAEWVVDTVGPDVPLHFSAFHPDFKMLDVPATPPATLMRAREVAMSTGVHYAYTGNIHDEASQSTHCHQCNALLIERDWYQLGQYNIRGGACSSCGTKIPGRFEDQPGTWGAKRLPVVV